jgi:hypothetical protein
MFIQTESRCACSGRITRCGSRNALRDLPRCRGRRLRLFGPLTKIPASPSRHVGRRGIAVRVDESVLRERLRACAWRKRLLPIRGVGQPMQADDQDQHRGERKGSLPAAYDAPLGSRILASGLVARSRCNRVVQPQRRFFARAAPIQARQFRIGFPAHTNSRRPLRNLANA